MLDAILFEKRGLPAAVVITEPFIPTAQAVARMQQMPEYPFIVVPHPVTSLTVRQAEALADAITDEVDVALTGNEPVESGRLAPLDLAELETRLAAGIRADGGDLSARIPAPSELILTLSIPDEACAECILPKSHLEAVFASIVAEWMGPGWHLTVHDPRE